MKYFIITALIFIFVKLNNGAQFTAGFYSKQSFPNRIPTSGTPGITMNQQLSGVAGNVQIAVDPKLIPIFSDLAITLWNGTIIYGQALDTDGNGYVIDILVDKDSDIDELGVKKVDVEIVDKLRKVKNENPFKPSTKSSS